MKRLIWIITTCIALTSCGDFFILDDSPDEWDGVTMTALNDSACLMVGDTLALQCEFLPMNPNGSSVFWTSSDPMCAMVTNDSLLAITPGKMEVRAINATGRLSDTIQVKVIERWKNEDFSFVHPSDMVIYADITVDEMPWDSETMIVGAFIRDELAGVAVKREAYGITYAEIRIWALADEAVGSVKLQCYDRRNKRLYVSLDDIEFNAYRTIGTLSDLYPININTISF